jgi:alpha-tubulin suppressor-like RCC1 family protein
MICFGIDDRMGGVVEFTANIRHMATGDHHSVLVGDDNKVYCLGQNNDGELGNTSNGYFPTITPLPLQASIGLPSVGISKVACGHNFTLFLSNAATVYSMGASCLGHRQSGAVYLPTLIKDTESVTVVSIGCGRQAAFAITADGNVLAWGNNSQGQLGLGNQSSQQRPQPITALMGKNVEMVR